MIMNTNDLSCLISKEEIPMITFSKEDVLTNKIQKSLRAYALNRASQLGNLLKNKVDIYFKNQEDKLMRVTTTVWAITSESVVLKKGIVIPRMSVARVD